MNTVQRTLGIGGLVPAVLLVALTSSAAVVSQRLSTGLPPSPTRTQLPEAWVTPAKEAPQLDGRLDDDAWTAAPPIVLGKLDSIGATGPRTEIRLAHKERVLYVGARLAEPNIRQLKRSVTTLDGPAFEDDSLELFLSPVPNRGYFQIILSATGAVFDRRDRSDPAHWHSGTKAAVAIGPDAWFVEAAIPMSVLGVQDDMPTRWQANIYRNRQAGPEGRNQAFSPTFRGDYDVPERFGYLLFTPTPPGAASGELAAKPRGLQVEELDDGTTVLLFDRRELPQTVPVHRAWLRCEREPMDGLNEDVLKPVEIYPLTAPYQKGRRPQVASKPLALVPPWYDAFDLTEWLQRWSAGQGTAGVWVKSFPGWRKDRTFLDLMFDGEPQSVPPAASGVRAVHRSGQTFLIWQEIDEPVGRDAITWGELKPLLNRLDGQRPTRYAIYRSTRPITLDLLPRAELIAEVKPLSGWNLNGRNIDRPIDHFIATARILNWHQWNPFQIASLDGDYGRDCAIDRFVIASGQPPLNRGTGLYVHTATRNEAAYYAVVTAVDGVENSRDVRAGLNVVGPINESVTEPEPVRQGELPPMPFFNYDQRRWHFVQWVAPPYSNKPYDYYNWSVGVPSDLAPGAALELNLHRDGYSYWRTHYRIEPGSVVLCPHDFPLKTWWCGYHEAQGTLRAWSDGVIRNYTEKRLQAFVEWATRQWPVNRKRILVTGCRGGASGSGALHLGLRHPDVFNLVISGHGQPSYAKAGADLERLWGKVSWGLKTDAGASVWEELDLVRRVRSLPRQTELPFVSLTYSEQQEQTDELVEALMAGGHAVVTHTAWGGQRLVPVSASATHWCLPLDIRQDRALLAVHALGKVGDAVRNGSLLWQTEDMVDTPDRYAITLRQTQGTFNGALTLRRLQQFKTQPGQRYEWKLESLKTGDVSQRQLPPPRAGVVIADASGLLTLTDVTIPAGTHRLIVTPGL